MVRKFKSREGLMTADRRTYIKTVGTAGIVGMAGCTAENEFPSQDIGVICPYAAGGGTDRTSRAFTDNANDYTDASMYVSNITPPEAGWEELKNADTDGHTIGTTTLAVAIHPHLPEPGPANPDDFKPIMQYNADPAALTVHGDAPYGTVQEFVKHARDNPDEIKVSNDGTGGIWHLAALGLEKETDLELEHIGYDGGAPATQAVMSGEVDATTTSAPEVAPQVQDGPLEILAVMGEERHPLFPETPTLMEKGIDFELGAWRSLGTPAGVSDDRIETLHEIYKSIYDSDEFKQFMEDNGFGLVYRGPEETHEYWRSEKEKFGNLMEEAGL